MRYFPGEAIPDTFARSRSNLAKPEWKVLYIVVKESELAALLPENPPPLSALATPK